MQNEIIDMIEETPKLNSRRCKLISLAISSTLRYFPYITTVISWLKYDYFIAFFTLILSLIVIGIIRAKIRNISIPIKQQEYFYSDKEISAWFTDKEICNDSLESKLEII